MWSLELSATCVLYVFLFREILYCYTPNQYEVDFPVISIVTFCSATTAFPVT